MTPLFPIISLRSRQLRPYLQDQRAQRRISSPAEVPPLERAAPGRELRGTVLRVRLRALTIVGGGSGNRPVERGTSRDSHFRRSLKRGRWEPGRLSHGMPTGLDRRASGSDNAYNAPEGIVKLASADRPLGAGDPWFRGGLGLRRPTGASDLGPSLERRGAGGAILSSGQAVAGQVEEIGDRIVDGQEPLHLAG